MPLCASRLDLWDGRRVQNAQLLQVVDGKPAARLIAVAFCGAVFRCARSNFAHDPKFLVMLPARRNLRLIKVVDNTARANYFGLNDISETGARGHLPGGV